MAGIAADTVAERLRDGATRLATLDALERHAAPIPSAATLAAAKPLLELMCMDEAEVDRGVFDRAGLLLGRLEAEAMPDVFAVHGAAFSDGGYERLWNANSVLNLALRKPSSQLTRADAVSYACMCAYAPRAHARGLTAALAASGLTVTQWIGLFMSDEPIVSQKKTPEDDVALKMMRLLIELLKSNELPELAIGGAWWAIHNCLFGGRSSSLSPAALECGVFELAVAQMKEAGSAADWVSISRGKAGSAGSIAMVMTYLARPFQGQESRPDVAACLASGFFDWCVEAVAAVAAAGVDGLSDTDCCTLYAALSCLRNNRAGSGCEAKIRGVARSLAFCLMNELDWGKEMGMTTASNAAQICEAQFLSNFCAAAGPHLTVSPWTRYARLKFSFYVTQAVACLAGTRVAPSLSSRR